jgi:hypothetical protein
MHVRLRLAVLAFAAPAIAAAQSPASSNGNAAPSSATPTAQAGPRAELTATAVRQTSARADEATPQRRTNSMGQPVALMVVGGVAIVVGAVIGSEIGTLVMVVGLVMLLVGLYKYLK